MINNLIVNRMFEFNCPNSNVDTFIVVFRCNNIIICEWNSNLKQWIEINKSISEPRLFLQEFDNRIVNGNIDWCYYSEFKRFMNFKQMLNIKNEV